MVSSTRSTPRRATTLATGLVADPRRLKDDESRPSAPSAGQFGDRHRPAAHAGPASRGHASSMPC